MKISKIFSVVFIFFFLNGFSQNQYMFDCDNEIEITSIFIFKSLGNRYRKIEEKKLIGISLSRNSNNECFLIKHYNTDNDEYLIRTNKLKIDSSVFEKIIVELNDLDLKKVSIDYNIADGIDYSLSFGNNIHKISVSTNSIDDGLNPENSQADFFKLFYDIWNLAEE